MAMPFTNPLLTPEETKAEFDKELEDARQKGRIPDFLLHALRREAVARAEIFQMLLGKLTAWLEEETELRESVRGISDRQAGAIDRLNGLETCIKQLTEVLQEVSGRLGELDGETGLLSTLFRRSEEAQAVWHRTHHDEHVYLLEAHALNHQEILANAESIKAIATDVADIKGVLADLHEWVGELRGENASRQKADSKQDLEIEALKARQEEETTGIHKRVDTALQTAEEAKKTAEKAAKKAKEAWLARGKKAGIGASILYSVGSVVWKLIEHFILNPPGPPLLP